MAVRIWYETCFTFFCIIVFAYKPTIFPKASRFSSVWGKPNVLPTGGCPVLPTASDFMKSSYMAELEL